MAIDKRKPNGIAISHDGGWITDKGIERVVVTDSPLGAKVTVENIDRTAKDGIRVDTTTVRIRGNKPIVKVKRHIQTTADGSAKTFRPEITKRDKLAIVNEASKILTKRRQELTMGMLAAFKEEKSDSRLKRAFDIAKLALGEPLNVRDESFFKRTDPRNLPKLIDYDGSIVPDTRRLTKVEGTIAAVRHVVSR